MDTVPDLRLAFGLPFEIDADEEPLVFDVRLGIVERQCRPVYRRNDLSTMIGDYPAERELAGGIRQEEGSAGVYSSWRRVTGALSDALSSTSVAGRLL